MKLFLICLSLCGLSLSTAAQAPRGSIVLDLRPYTTDLSELSFTITDVIDETGTEGRIGTGHKGMLNAKRPIHVYDGLRIGVLSLIIRNTVNRDRPQATLVLTGVNIEEAITMTSERRNLQVEAWLERTDENEQVHRIGPVQFTETKGGLDVTGGHAAALARGIEGVLYQLMQLETAAPAEVPDTIFDGAYYSLYDFRAGRTDTSLVLLPQQVVATSLLDGYQFYRAEFQRPKEVKRREVRELWGYRSEGRDYLHINGAFFEVIETSEGDFLSALPRSLYSPGAEITEGAVIGGLLFGALGASIIGSMEYQKEMKDVGLFRLNLTSGRIEPHATDAELEAQDRLAEVRRTGGTFLRYAPDSPGTTPVLLTAGTEQYRLLPGEYVLLTEAIEINCQTEGGKARSYTLYSEVDRIELHTFSVTKKGRIFFKQENDQAAEQFAMDR